MKISERLDYLEVVELGGEAVISDIFAALARKDNQENEQRFAPVEEQVEMRTTSLRMDAPTLAAFDAVARRFELSRNEAFSYAVHSFISDAINGYALGSAESQPKDDRNLLEVFSDERDELIMRLDCDIDTQDNIKEITKNDFVKKLKELANATN